MKCINILGYIGALLVTKDIAYHSTCLHSSPHGMIWSTYGQLKFSVLVRLLQNQNARSSSRIFPPFQ